MEVNDFMRLFVALDIPENIRHRISQFATGLRNFAPDAKWVGPETFHVTLKFIGEKSAADTERIKQALRNVQAQPFEVSFRGYGFFPNPNRGRVFWTGIEADERLRKLASAVDEATAAVGVPRETALYSPHLTLARARGASGSPRSRHGERAGSSFIRVHEKLQALPSPEFGTMTATEFFLYESKLSPKGAQYTKMERFALNG